MSLSEITNKLEDLTLERKNDNVMAVMAIDIGILHLGISVSLVDSRYNLIEVVWVDLVNITKYVHHYGPSRDECKLYHTKGMYDWLYHVFQENIQFFEQSDVILIERQPITGHTVVEQIIFGRWRDKAILISPSSMHKHFHMGKLDYNSRKNFTESIAIKHITNESLRIQYLSYKRQHDIADSICIMLYWIHMKQDEFNRIEKRKRVMQLRSSRDPNLTTEEFLTQFELKI